MKRWMLTPAKEPIAENNTVAVYAARHPYQTRTVTLAAVRKGTMAHIEAWTVPAELAEPCAAAYVALCKGA